MLVIVDVETTSKDPYTCKVLEIGAVSLDGHEKFSSLVNPGYIREEHPEPPAEILEALRVNMIPWEDVLNAPKINDVVGSFAKWCDRDDICFTGWNCLFYDAKVLARPPWTIDPKIWIFDAMLFAQNFMGPRGMLNVRYDGSWKWPNLKEAMYKLELPSIPGDQHRAAFDVEMTRRILLQIFYGGI